MSVDYGRFFLENPEPFDEFRNQGRFGPQSFRPKSFWPILALIHFTDLFWTLEEYTVHNNGASTQLHK